MAAVAVEGTARLADDELVAVTEHVGHVGQGSAAQAQTQGETKGRHRVLLFGLVWGSFLGGKS